MPKLTISIAWPQLPESALFEAEGDIEFMMCALPYFSLSVGAVCAHLITLHHLSPEMAGEVDLEVRKCLTAITSRESFAGKFVNLTL